jgi:hypothetical protein
VVMSKELHQTSLEDVLEPRGVPNPHRPDLTHRPSCQGDVVSEPVCCMHTHSPDDPHTLMHTHLMRFWKSRNAHSLLDRTHTCMPYGGGQPVSASAVPQFSGRNLSLP